MKAAGTVCWVRPICFLAMLLLTSLGPSREGMAAAALCKQADEGDLNKLRGELELALVDAPAARFRDVCVYEFDRQTDSKVPQQMRTYCGYIIPRTEPADTQGTHVSFMRRAPAAPAFFQRRKSQGTRGCFW